MTEVVPNRIGFGQVLSSVGNGPLRTRVQYAFDRSVYSLHFVRTGAQIGEWRFDNGIGGSDVGILDGIDSHILDLIGDRFIVLQLLFHFNLQTRRGHHHGIGQHARLLLQIKLCKSPTRIIDRLILEAYAGPIPFLVVPFVSLPNRVSFCPLMC